MRDQLSGKPDSVFEAPCIRVEQHGRFLRYLNTNTEQEALALRKQFADYRQHLKEIIEQNITDIETVLNNYDAVNMIAVYAFGNSIIDPETYKEYSFEGRPLE